MLHHLRTWVATLWVDVKYFVAAMFRSWSQSTTFKYTYKLWWHIKFKLDNDLLQLFLGTTISSTLQFICFFIHISLSTSNCDVITSSPVRTWTWQVSRFVSLFDSEEREDVGFAGGRMGGGLRIELVGLILSLALDSFLVHTPGGVLAEADSLSLSFTWVFSSWEELDVAGTEPVSLGLEVCLVHSRVWDFYDCLNLLDLKDKMKTN